MPNDNVRHDLSKKAIIPVKGELRAPSTLAFHGKKGDFWGDWKIRLTTEGLSQNDQSHYRDIGVTSTLPNQETSQAFFQWLSTQNQAVLRRHIPCILRHFLSSSGPSSWAEVFTDTPCIPTKNHDGLQLVTLRSVQQRKPIFLSDAGEIGEQVIERDSAVQLVVEYAREVRKPITKQLRELGIRSLRENLKDPVSARSFGEVVPVDDDTISRFQRLKSPRFQRTFEKRLVKLGVEIELIRHDWRERLNRVKELYFCDALEVCYRFRGKSYLQIAHSGFDPNTGTFYVKQRLGSLYESVAKQLVFKPAIRPIDLLALERALELEISDPSFGRWSSSESDAHNDEFAADAWQITETDSELGEAGVRGHSPFVPDPARNKPNPNPITNESPLRPRQINEQSSSPGSRSGNTHRHIPELEAKHKSELKLQHYAAHCQMCLCERPPKELAPIGSYVYEAEVRTCIMEAHHPDRVESGGARHAGNLVLLCKLHHDNYGNKFSRADITTALQKNSKKMSICFDEGTYINGKKIEIEISSTGEIVNLFFTDYHAEYWLSQESEPE